MAEYDQDQYSDGEDLTQIRDVKPKEDPHGLIGHTLDGRYHIQSVIGVGGMGVVYRGRQEAMDRTVAVKVLMPQMIDDESLIKRFHLEARAASRLTHPNTITVYDFGRSGDLLFIVMEFLEGRNLEKALKEQGNFSPERVGRIASQVLGSLAEAHEKEIVHRDIKPDNIWLKEVGDQKDFVKVLDFGVAKLKDPKVTDTTMTQAGMIFGTPKYMSPEQAKAKKLDGRSDLYSLGVVMYQALMARVPFLATDPVSILIQHVHDPPPPFREVRPDLEIPRVLEEIVFKSLEKDRTNRFADAKEMRQAVDAFLAGQVSQSFQNIPVMLSGAQPPYAPSPGPAGSASTIEQPSPTPSAGYGPYPYGAPPSTPQPGMSVPMPAQGMGPSGPQIGPTVDPAGQSVWNMGAEQLSLHGTPATEWVRVQPGRSNTALLATAVLLGLLLLAGIGYLIFRIQLPTSPTPGTGEALHDVSEALDVGGTEEPTQLALLTVPDAGPEPVVFEDAGAEIVVVPPIEPDAGEEQPPVLEDMAMASEDPVEEPGEASDAAILALAAEGAVSATGLAQPVRVRFQFERPSSGVDLDFGSRRFGRDPAAEDVWIFDLAEGNRLTFEASAQRYHSSDFDEDISQVGETGEVLLTIRLRRIRTETQDPCVDPVTGLRDPYCRP